MIATPTRPTGAAGSIRLIAATNADLKEMVRTGTFRQDLYYRLHVFPVEMPPLRERRDDIALLVESFLGKFGGIANKSVTGVSAPALRALERYDWPGNIRELENLIERACVIAQSSVITPECLPPELTEASQTGLRIDFSESLDQVRRQAVKEVEKRYLTDLLARHHGRIDRSASDAGITPRQLHTLLARHGIDKAMFRHRNGESASRRN